MNKNIKNKILKKMKKILTKTELLQLENVLNDVLSEEKPIKVSYFSSNSIYIDKFIESKSIEGCSIRTQKYYRYILEDTLKIINKKISKIDTEDIRECLNDIYENNNVSMTSIDNIRRVLSSFFSWLEIEDYISKSPVRRIHKIKGTKVIKKTYTNESLQLLKDNSKSLRDLCIIELLASSGIRVGELVKINIRDINFETYECTVLGKGNKQRIVYFDSATKVHLMSYIKSRKDQNEALFVSKLKPYNRLNIAGVEIMLRKLGKELGIDKVHPHKFRRTLATNAIDKGMPIEQVQRLLGHTKIDTTMEYAIVDQMNVKNSYIKYMR